MTAKKRDDRVRNSVWRARGFEHECCYDILRSRIFKLQKISIFFFLLLLLFVVYALNETYSNPRGSFKYDNRERVDRFNFRFRAERGIHRCFFFFFMNLYPKTLPEEVLRSTVCFRYRIAFSRRQFTSFFSIFSQAHDAQQSTEIS